MLWKNWGITIGLSLSIGQMARAQAFQTAGNDGEWGKFDVGSSVIHIELTDTGGDRRPMDVLLLYPADKQAYGASDSLTVYRQRLNGVTLDPANWDPLSWTVVSERAKDFEYQPPDAVPVDQGGPSFPLILFSHAGQGQPINYTGTLERIASHGFIIAAPWHEGDNRDDRTIDQINQLWRASNPSAPPLLKCFDGLPSPCSDGVQKSVQNGVRDFGAIIDNIGVYFGDRVDLEHIGVFGQSRGSVRALAGVGGSAAWKIAPDPRIGAVMILAIGAPSVVSNIDLSNITVPSLLVAGKLDMNTPAPISVSAFKTIPAENKGLVILERAHHATYSVQICPQMQITGATFQANKHAIGERLGFESAMTSTVSGIPLDYCTYDYFVNPVDIRPLVQSYTKVWVTTDNVPRQLDTDNAMRIVVELATTFFDAVLVKNAQSGVHFTQYMSPKFIFLKEGDEVGYAESWSFQGRPAECDDPSLVSYDLECD